MKIRREGYGAGILLAVAVAVCGEGVARGEEWRDLFNGKNLDGWEVRGEGLWTAMSGGTLLGQRVHRGAGEGIAQWPIDLRQFRSWASRQAWLYTKQDFGEFDLHVEYWLPPRGNSGVSIRDISRAHYVIGEPDSVWMPPQTAAKGSPAHIGYEIQIIDPDNNSYSSGSVYLFAAAKTGVHKSVEWNALDIESRKDAIRIRLNGEAVAESAGDPARSKTGPIGLQLHDQFTFAMFRNIRIREIRR